MRPQLVLTQEEVQHLKRLRRSLRAPAREVQRAEILWRYHCGQTIAEIMRTVKMTRKSVGKWIERALAMGVEAALKDAYHRPWQPRISEEAKAWVVHLACSKPKQLGYAAELWTRSALAGTCVSMPWKRAIRHWRKQPRRPSTGFWRSSRCIRRR